MAQVVDGVFVAALKLKKKAWFMKPAGKHPCTSQVCVFFGKNICDLIFDLKMTTKLSVTPPPLLLRFRSL